MSSFNDEEIQYLLKKASNILSEKEMSKMLLYLGDVVGTYGEGLEREYPPDPGGRELTLYYPRVDANGRMYLSKFKSLAQQRKVFWLGNRNKIPYKRTGTLGKSITHQVVQVDNGVAVSVGTNLFYAPVVIGPKLVQSHYHIVTGWISLPDNLGNHTDDFEELIKTTLDGYIRGAMSK